MDSKTNSRSARKHHSRLSDGASSCSSTSSSAVLSDGGAVCLDPLPLLALPQHRCDSVLLQAHNQAVLRINVLQQILAEMSDHLYIHNDDDDFNSGDYPTDLEPLDDNEDEESHSESSSGDDDGTVHGDIPDEVALNADLAESLMELAAFAITPQNRRQRGLPGRGARPR